MPLPKFTLQFAFSLSVYFSNRTESYLIFGRSRPWSARLYIKSSVCLLVCWSAFYRPHEISYFAALPPSPRAGAVGRPRASGQACTARARARMPYNILLNEKIVALIVMPFKNKTVRGRMLSYTYLPRFSKKGKKKTNMPLPKFSLQFAFSWSVYFSNRTESYSSQIEFAGPHGITENQATYLHCGGEARAKKRARPPATCRKASTGKTGADYCYSTKLSVNSVLLMVDHMY